MLWIIAYDVANAGNFSVKPINERVQPPAISPEDYKYFIGYLLSMNKTEMLDMDCKEGDCQIRIMADGILVGKLKNLYLR